MPASFIDRSGVSARVRHEAIESSATPGDLLDALAGEHLPALLDSSAADPRYGRYSVVACRPAEVVSLVDGRLIDRAGRTLPGATVLEALRAVLARVRTPAEPDAAYGPGWIGYIGYEFGRCLERLPARAVRDTALPDLHLGFYDAVAVHDAIARSWRIAWLDFGRDGPDTGAHDVLREMLCGAGGGVSPPAAPAGAAPADYESNFTPEDYRRAVARCIDYIAAGDIFQVNLSQRLTVPDAPAPVAVYRALRRRNPAWYSAMLLLGESAILSSSPELFLRVRGKNVLTRPIKGTRPRTGDARADAAAAAALVGSPKDNA